MTRSKWIIPVLLAITSIVLLCLQFAFPILQTSGKLSVDSKEETVPLMTFTLYEGYANCYIPTLPIDEADTMKRLKGSFSMFHKYKAGEFPHTELELTRKAYKELDSNANSKKLKDYLWNMQEYRDLKAMEFMDEYEFSGDVAISFFFTKSLIISGVSLGLLVFGTIILLYTAAKYGKKDDEKDGKEAGKGDGKGSMRLIILGAVSSLLFTAATALLGFLIVCIIHDLPTIRRDAWNNREVLLEDSWNYYYLIFSFSSGCMLSQIMTFGFFTDLSERLKSKRVQDFHP